MMNYGYYRCKIKSGATDENVEHRNANYRQKFVCTCRISNIMVEQTYCVGNSHLYADNSHFLCLSFITSTAILFFYETL